MPFRPISQSIFAALFTLSFVAISSPAFAGFQWVAPSEPVVISAPVEQPHLLPSPSVSASPPQGQVTSVGPAVASPEVISPVIIEGQPSPTPTAAVSTPDPLPPSPVPVSAPTPAPAPIAAVASDDAIVRGFAKQVPISFALRQILPAGYGFSIDPDVDLGVLISFQGGKPWRDTLFSALEPVGLSMHEQGQMVVVSRIRAETPTSASASFVPAEAPHILQPPPDSGPVTTPALESLAQVSPNATSIVEMWSAERGDSLHKILEKWSRRSSVELSWNSEYDYPIQASINFSGTFEDAVRTLLSGFENANPQPVGQLHANPNLGQMVLVVETRGNSYNE